MANITIYLPDEVERRIRQAAQAQGKSVSRWISSRLTELVDESPASELLRLAGTFPDFPGIDDLRNGYGPDARRAKVE